MALRIARLCPADRNHSLGHAPMLGLRPVLAQDLDGGFFQRGCCRRSLWLRSRGRPAAGAWGRAAAGGHRRARAMRTAGIGAGALFAADTFGLVPGLTAAPVVAARTLLARRFRAVASLTHLPRIAIGGLGRRCRGRNRAELASRTGTFCRISLSMSRRKPRSSSPQSEMAEPRRRPGPCGRSDARRFRRCSGCRN